LKRFLFVTLILVGCGDDTTAMTPDGPSVDHPMIDAATHDAPTADAPVDAPAGDAAEPDAMADAMPDGAALCPTPIRALLPNDSYDGTLSGTSLNPSTTCQASTGGPEDVFTIHLDTPQVVVFSTEGARTTIDTVVEVRRNCDDPTSAVLCDDDSGRSTTTLLRNFLDPGDYFVLVDQYSSGVGTGGPYNLSVASFTPAPNARCEAAIALAEGAPLMNQSSMGGGPFATPCGDGLTGGQVYYSLAIPPLKRANVTATPTGTAWTPTVRILDACGASQGCFTTTTGMSGMPARAHMDNSSMQTRNVIVAVAGGSTATGGMFNLDVVTTPLPYDEQPTPAGCEDVSAGTVLTGVTADDSASPITALPFTFRFFGQDMTFYSVTSNGFMQLWPSMTGTPSTEYNNAIIPTAGDPNGFIAPFWDDLTTITGETTEVRALATGTSPMQHLTIQWTNWMPYAATGAHLTFQVTLFETSNLIELHYCTLTPGMSGDRVTGNSATIGIESADGTDGFLHSFQTPAAISTAGGLRFAPR
jgi:hypothetical protein